MKKSILSFIGIFAILSSIVSFYKVAVIIKGSAQVSLVSAICGIVLAWIALYGGYQTIRHKAIGRNLLLIYFTCQIPYVLIFIFTAVFFGKIPTSAIQINSPQGWLNLFSLISCVLSALALILLLTKDSFITFFEGSNTSHSILIGKILSQLTPGLGKALLGNTFTGAGLFFLYYILMKVLSIMFIGLDDIINDITNLNISFNLITIVKLIVWIFFASTDLNYVKNSSLAKENISSAVPMLYSGQKSG
jgi:hypothetical protein